MTEIKLKEDEFAIVFKPNGAYERYFDELSHQENE